MKQTILCLMLLIAAFFLPVQSEAAGVEVGGIHILMTNVTGEPLPDAEFELYRQAEDGELSDSRLEKKLLTIGEEHKIMIREDFWDNRGLSGEKAARAVTDENGMAAIYGLPYGTYYLVETDAPEGYNRISTPIRISIHKYSHLTESDNVTDDRGEVIDNTLHIINIRYTLPETGSMDRIRLTAGFVGILFSAAALLLLNYRRRKW